MNQNQIKKIKLFVKNPVGHLSQVSDILFNFISSQFKAALLFNILFVSSSIFAMISPIILTENIANTQKRLNPQVLSIEDGPKAQNFDNQSGTIFIKQDEKSKTTSDRPLKSAVNKANRQKVFVDLRSRIIRFPATLVISTSLAKRAIHFSLFWKPFHKYAKPPIYLDQSSSLSYGFYLNGPNFLRPFIYQNYQRKSEYRIIYDGAVKLYKQIYKLLQSDESQIASELNQQDLASSLNSDVLSDANTIAAATLRAAGVDNLVDNVSVENQNSHQRQEVSRERSKSNKLFLVTGSFASSIFFQINLLDTLNFVIEP